jgi:hypothetical protein
MGYKMFYKHQTIDYGELHMTEHAAYILENILKQSRESDYPSLSPDKYFEIFSSQQALKTLSFNLDPIEIESGIVGGENDGGVDGIYLFVNKKFIREDTDIIIFKGQQLNIELVVVQGKNKPSFEESVPIKLGDFANNCLGARIDSAVCEKLYNSSLIEVVRKFQNTYTMALTLHPSLNFYFFHVTHGDQIDPKVEERSRLLQEQVKQMYPTSSCKYEFIGGSKLIKLYDQQPETTLKLYTDKYFDYQSYEATAYLCIVKLSKFYEFITSDNVLREYIFEANVRDHAPDAKVNKGIRGSLAVPQDDDFWWLNNGITILGSHVFYGDGAVQITNPLIVNGLQTSHEVYKHFVRGALIQDKRSIMVKVIQSNNETTSDNIIRATNSQTKIDSISLHATEQIHRDIEKALKAVGLFYDRRKNFYRNKGESASKIITIAYMAQSIAAIVLQQPNDARARPTTLADKSYKKLFAESHPISLYPKCAQIMKRVDSYIDGIGLSQGSKLNIVFYLGMYVTCVVLKSVKPKPPKIQSLDMTLLTDDILNECYTWISEKFKELGGNDTTAKGPNLVKALREQIISQLATGHK